MNKKKITSLLIQQLHLSEAIVTGDNNHIKVIAIGNIFKGMSAVKRQQMIYAPLTKMIIEKKVHSVSIISYTPEEWKKNNKTQNDINSL